MPTCFQFLQISPQYPDFGRFRISSVLFSISFEVRCWRWGGTGLTHREPLVDETHVECFVQTVLPLLKPSRDIVWILCGRTKSNVPKLEKILDKYQMRHEEFSLCYNTKQMAQYGYFKRQRGIANSKNLEVVLCAFLGKMPKNMPKNRHYVDASSSLFNQVVRSVPVLNPKHQAYVSKAVRKTSLESMVGTPHDEDQDELAKQTRDDEEDILAVSASLPSAGPDEQQKTVQIISGKKRKLYRQVSGTDVPWFPHDNDIELLKELCWEAGRPRWVLHGTPAGGAGIHGCFEMGCSVVALCYDDHHRTHLQKFLVQRAVEAMASGTTLVFKEEALQKRSDQLNLTSPAKLLVKKKGDGSDGEKEAKKGKSKTTPKKSKRKADEATAVSSTTSGSTSSSSSSRGKKTQKKK